ncbi:MAG: protein kinase [Ktedonobacteraceae bacterium]|nr:protein kinase [Ktedonobacteraceae bacterium]
MNELAGNILGGYYLEEEIGRGSMGVVYRGKQMALGREVAIKLLPQSHARDASYVARFIREAYIIAGLNHPNIVQIYDAGQHNKILYFVMEYVQGPTLAHLLQLDGIITPHLAVEYAAQIAEALDAAYSERNVIHRDIKPENLMLNRWGKIKVMDFGLARATGQQKITVAKTLVGSIYYSSPEQIWGYVLDNRSDIYALGVVLYEMVTGRRPFNGRSMPELTHAITNNPPVLPRTYNPSLPVGLEHIIMTALAKDRDQRYAHAGLMAQHLRMLSMQPPPATQYQPFTPLPPTQLPRNITPVFDRPTGHQRTSWNGITEVPGWPQPEEEAPSPFQANTQPQKRGSLRSHIRNWLGRPPRE